MIDACRKKYNSTAKDMSDYGWILYEEAKTSDDYIESNTWFQDGIKKDGMTGIANDTWKHSQKTKYM